MKNFRFAIYRNYKDMLFYLLMFYTLLNKKSKNRTFTFFNFKIGREFNAKKNGIGKFLFKAFLIKYLKTH